MTPLLLRGASVIAALAVFAAACGGSGDVGVGELHFADVAGEVGLDFEHGAFNWDVSADPAAMMGGGVCWLDADNDGWMDLYVVNTYALDEWGMWNDFGGLPTNVLFRNDEGRFSAAESSGANLAVRGNGCVAADLNADGWTDLYVTTSEENRLLWNDGDGTFTEGGTAAGVAGFGWHAGAAAGDLNGDGLLELFVAGYVDINNRKPEAAGGFPRTHFGVRDLLYVNQGVGPDGLATFTEVGADVGLEDDDFEYGLGAVMADFDGDGDLDVYVTNETNPNRLYLSEPDKASPAGFRLEEVASAAGVADAGGGMGVAGADFDGNAAVDLFVTNFGNERHALYANDGGRFRDVTAEVGIETLGTGESGWGATWADFDLDGDLDLMVAHGEVPVTDLAADSGLVQVFQNLAAGGGSGFVEAAAGLPEAGEVLARGSAAADYDNDGDIDVAVATISGKLVLLENRTGGGSWLTVQASPPTPGTVVRATLDDGRTLSRTVQAGSSYLSSEDPRAHFGLGDAEVVEVIVRWPDGSTAAVASPGSNRVVEIPAAT
jgi:hypothetical protein